MIGLGDSSNGIAVVLLVGLCLLFVWLAVSIAITITKVALQKRRLVGTRFVVSQEVKPTGPIIMEMQGISLTLESDDPIAAGSWAKVVSIRGNRVKVSPLAPGGRKQTKATE